MRVITKLLVVLVAGMLCTGAWAEKSEAKSSGGKQSLTFCKGKIRGTDFKSAKTVWWGHTSRSYGNYLKFDKAKLPPKVVKVKPKPVKQPEPPKFDPIYFDLDKAVLRPDGAKVADQVTHYLKANAGKKVRIEGNCCDLASTEYNVKLGMRRAEAVKKYLVEHGIDASRIGAVSFGEEKRVTEDPKARPLNRRADVIVVVLKDDKKK